MRNYAISVFNLVHPVELYIAEEHRSISHRDHNDAILFLLAQGADPNQSTILRWVVLYYFHQQYSTYAFNESMRCIIQ
jgi:hypothetical protein